MRFTETATLVVLAARAGLALQGEFKHVKALIVRNEEGKQGAPPSSYDATTTGGGDPSFKPHRRPGPKPPSYTSDDPSTAPPSYTPSDPSTRPPSYTSNDPSTGPPSYAVHVDPPTAPPSYTGGGGGGRGRTGPEPIPGFPYCIGQFAYEGCPYCPSWYPGPPPPAPPLDNPCQYGCDPQWCPWQCEVPPNPCSSSSSSSSGCFYPPVPCSSSSSSSCIQPPVPCSSNSDSDISSGCYVPPTPCPYDPSGSTDSSNCTPLCPLGQSTSSDGNCIPICDPGSSSSSYGCIPICPSDSSSSDEFCANILFPDSSAPGSDAAAPAGAGSPLGSITGILGGLGR
ncbi:hypothetical protein CLAFUW4_07560 [Fulvia fulva]|uniref:Uncharacterized protein n=1 Tax=Passalora fulva TaxID=5499 RepID=A0A9Q8PAP7_PASFU|nr:uncharacterized protein CLAFUR5_07690 [Fulvia fulva]KAK4621611.1 hypothetical protein CLAFUR4_07566 [Fulvia fulva]KAK4622651.1 hypothetical protein CLAFUR0_07565 [Fulvia fulva]UJO18960.1 hypothetical protein CLAFUR5_07690 [Fulvia fulva]WPV16188.1 hypothetical protein CLAFUW4_07560 [Fulvia fulva]WPV31161.1 hypothetical protein CLAFUW7_07562 [Fulvia fulva]